MRHETWKQGKQTVCIFFLSFFFFFSFLPLARKPCTNTGQLREDNIFATYANNGVFVFHPALDGMGVKFHLAMTSNDRGGFTQWREKNESKHNIIRTNARVCACAFWLPGMLIFKHAV